MGAVLATAACGTPQAGPPPPATPPDSAGDRHALYHYCETAAPAGDPLCHTTQFGMVPRAADEVLEGVDVGPGGLKEMTATDDGFPAGATIVGSPVDMVNATWTLDLSEVIESEGACDVLIDRATHLAVVTDLDDAVQAFIIMNPVVQTHEEVGIGSTLAEIQASYSVEVVDTEDGRFAFTVRENVTSPYENVEPSRAMLFALSTDDIVQLWIVGATSYVGAATAEGLCPAP